MLIHFTNCDETMFLKKSVVNLEIVDLAIKQYRLSMLARRILKM